MTEFDPAYVRWLHGDSPSFDEDLRPRLRHNPIFDEALATQLVFSDEAVPADELNSYWTKTSVIVDSLDTRAKMMGLLGRPAMLRGQEVEVPTWSMDFENNIARFSLMDPERRQKHLLETSLSPQEVSGTFVGFTIRFEEREDKLGHYRPLLAYMLAMNHGYVPNMTFTLCATGNVGRTELSFEEDERLDERRDLLSKLFKLAPKSGERINRINLSLLDTASHNAESLRLVAFDVEKILILTPIELQPLVEDALANLIKHYVKARSSHKFSAKTFQRSDSDVPSGSHVRVATKANPFEFTEIIDDVVFMDRPRDTQKQNPDPKKRRGAYLVAKDYSSETHIFVPMIELVEFSRQ